MKPSFLPIFLIALSLSAVNISVNAAYGDLLWTALTGGSIYGPPAIGPSGEIVVGTEDSNIYSFNPDGSLRWIFSESPDWIDSAPTIAPDGTVYAGSWDQYLYAIDGKTGKLLWKFETGAIIIASPAVGEDGTIYVASNDSFLYAVHPDGSQKWLSEPVDSFSPINSSPVLSHDGDTVYFGNDTGEFFAVDAGSGREKWVFDLTTIHPPDAETDYAIVGSAAVGEDGNLYFGSENGYLYALSSQGKLRWTYKAAESIRSSPAISRDGIIYFPSQDGYLYALDTEGFQLWETYVGDVFYCSPAIDGEGNIIVASYAGSSAFGAATDFLALDPVGNIIWEYLITDYNDSSPNIAPDGSIYFGAHDGYLYKFAGSAPLMEGQWPRFQSNRGQSGLHPQPWEQDIIEVFPAITMINGDWLHVPWFGSGWIQDTPFPWVHHLDHGSIYVAASSPESATFYDPHLGQWLEASLPAGQNLYSYSLSRWIYHVEGTSIFGGRLFYDYATQSWFSDSY